MIYGTDKPKIELSTRSTAIVLPHPTRRSMDPNEVAEDFENRDNVIFKLFDVVEESLCRYRPKFRLFWQRIVESDLDNIIAVVNANPYTAKIKFFPHQDIDFIAYDVIVNDYDFGHPLDNINYDSVEIEFITRQPISNMPSPDNMLAGGLGAANQSGSNQCIFELSTELFR